MNRHLTIFLMAAALIAVGASSATATYIVSTFDAGGADAEVRESNPIQNRGDSTEIASRVAPQTSGTRNSHIFLKWGIQDVSAGHLSGDITIRNFFRQENLSGGRIRDTDAVGPDEGRTGFNFYVLDPTLAGANWLEVDAVPDDGTGITYMNAPGLSFDANTNTKDIVPGEFTFIGTQLLRDLNDENHLPVGEAFDLVVSPGNPLYAAIEAALGTDHQTLTVLATTQHSVLTTVSNWKNFNYILNPKEQDPLRDDAGYDMDVSAGNGPEGSPWGGMANDMGQFSPQLIFTIPEPSALLLIGLGTAALLAFRRHK